MKVWHPNLTTKVASSFLLLSLLTVAVVGSVAFVKARHALKTAAFDRLSVTATLKEGEITRWFEEQKRDFFLITQFPDIQANLAEILEQPKAETNIQLAHDELFNYLTEIQTIKPNFQELFVTDRTNKVILSTNRSREGEYEVLANITYLNRLEPDSPFSPIFYVSAETGKPAVTLAAPYRDRDGVRQGLILASLNLNRIDQIVRDRTGLGESGETYLVGSLVIGNAFISKEAIQNKFSGMVSSYGIDAAMRGESNIGLYKNYANVPVIGVYRWLNHQDIALLAEMSQDEAFLPARELASTIVLVGLLSVSVLTVGVYWLTHQLHLYRLQLESYSHRLEQKAEEANAANLAKSKFLANMSHELRTPLNAILGFAQLMVRDRTITPTHREHLEIINRSGEHLLTLINDVLEMSKIEAGRIVLNENSFDLYRLLDSLEEMLTLKARSKGLWLTFDRHPAVPQYIQADEGKLRQILINLMGNAIKFTTKGGVTLRVKPGVGDWQVESKVIKVPTDHLLLMPYPLDFEVEDTGSGIAPHELDSLFEPFVQTESGRKSKQGTGLGLPISRQYVSLMGGDIRVSSVLDRGTIFGFNVWVHLAPASDVLPHRVRQTVVGLAPNQPTYRILIVEDRWENRQLLVKMLSPLGFEIREAENGEEGLKLWESWEPHLIWMDMRMPVMDGYEATKRIRRHLKGQATVIIALTASAFEEARSIILATGCDDFVRKPFQEHVIFDKMAEHLGVRYLYADESPPPSAPLNRLHQSDEVVSGASTSAGSASTVSASNVSAPTTLTAADFAGMSPDWVAQLHQAAMRVNAKQISQLIEQIPNTNPHLAKGIINLVNRFNFEEIVALTHQASASPQNSHKRPL